METTGGSSALSCTAVMEEVVVSDVSIGEARPVELSEYACLAAS